MPIFLNKEFETQVNGDGCGFICITQKNNEDEEVSIWLSVNQFQTIFNHEKFILKEALNESSDDCRTLCQISH